MLKPKVEVRNEGGILVAEFWDCLRLDPNPVRDLRQHYEAHLRAKGKPDLVVDLNGVVFAGSASLGGFLALQRLARQQSGRVVFCNVEDDVHEVFRISKLAPMFVFLEDLPAALAYVARPAEGPEDLGTQAPPEPGPSPQPPTAPRAEGPLRRSRRREP